EWRIEGGAAALGVLRFVSAFLNGIHRRIACGQAEIGCPLKDVKMLRLLCDDRYRLDARRTGSNHAYSQSGEVDSLMGPQPGMIPFSLETLQTREAWRPRRRKIARRHDAKARGRSGAFVSLYRPCVGLAVEDRLFDPSVKLDVAPEVEAVSHMVDVPQDLRLRAVALGPMPFLLQLVRKGIRVLHAFDV